MNISGNQVTVSYNNVIVFAFILDTTSHVDFSGLASTTIMNAQAAGFNAAGIGHFTTKVSVTVP